MVDPKEQREKRLDPAEYWKKPGDLRPPREYWVDPQPEVRGMLSADRIRYYVEEVGMIDPFDENKLKPASYSLTLGPLCQIEGRDKVLTPEKPVLEIPKNSIAFVSMGERLLLPHYIAARFNLSIDLIYRGLLLGTGPQVDPGFQGVLSCPLHNISNNPIRIRLGQHVATIDFVKTTGIGTGSTEFLEEITDEKTLYENQDKLVGVSGYKNRLFKQDKRWLRPILSYPSGEIRVSSSVAPLSRTITRFKLTGYIGLGFILGLVVALIHLNIQSYRLYVDACREWQAITSAVGTIQATQEQVQDAQNRLADRLAEVEAKVTNFNILSR